MSKDRMPWFMPQHSKRHRNPNGSIGGWVAPTAHVDPTAHLGRDVVVCGTARVQGNTSVHGRAFLYSGETTDGVPKGRQR